MVQIQQQQAVVEKYAFSQIQNNMTDKISVENAKTLINKGKDVYGLKISRDYYLLS
jgi:hypothetical protein